jgi:hypothetical protein
MSSSDIIAMYSPSNDSSPADFGVADYFNSHPEEVTSILIAKAPDVLVLAHCIGAPKTAKYFESRLKCKVTEKMIKGIKSRMAMDIIVVTREELEAAALSHPITAARRVREPYMCDPKHYRAANASEPEQEKIEDGSENNSAAEEAGQPTKKKKGTEKKMPNGEKEEKPNLGATQNTKKTEEAFTGVETKSDPKLLTDQEMQQAAALLDADDAEYEDLHS